MELRKKGSTFLTKKNISVPLKITVDYKEKCHLVKVPFSDIECAKYLEIIPYILKVFISLKVRIRGRKRPREKRIFHQLVYSKWQQCVELNQAKPEPEVVSGCHSRWEGPSYSRHLPIPSQVHQWGACWEMEQQELKTAPIGM